MIQGSHRQWPLSLPLITPNPNNAKVLVHTIYIPLATLVFKHTFGCYVGHIKAVKVPIVSSFIQELPLAGCYLHNT